MKKFLYGSALTVIRLDFPSASMISLPPLPLDFSSEVIQAKNVFFSFFNNNRRSQGSKGTARIQQEIIKEICEEMRG